MAAAVATPLPASAPAKSADFDYSRYQEKIKEYVVKVRTLNTDLVDLVLLTFFFSYTLGWKVHSDVEHHNLLGVQYRRVPGSMFVS